MALVFGALGAMGAYGYFFWENREMSPCAPVGIAGAEHIEVAQPYSSELLIHRSLVFGGVAALIGIVVGIAVVAPRASRMKKI
jgi:hypothetical protein